MQVEDFKFGPIQKHLVEDGRNILSRISQDPEKLHQLKNAIGDYNNKIKHHRDTLLRDKSNTHYYDVNKGWQSSWSPQKANIISIHEPTRIFRHLLINSIAIFSKNEIFEPDEQEAVRSFLMDSALSKTSDANQVNVLTFYLGSAESKNEEKNNELFLKKINSIFEKILNPEKKFLSCVEKQGKIKQKKQIKAYEERINQLNDQLKDWEENYTLAIVRTVRYIRADNWRSYKIENLINQYRDKNLNKESKRQLDTLVERLGIIKTLLEEIEKNPALTELVNKINECNKALALPDGMHNENLEMTIRNLTTQLSESLSVEKKFLPLSATPFERSTYINWMSSSNDIKVMGQIDAIFSPIAKNISQRSDIQKDIDEITTRLQNLTNLPANKSQPVDKQLFVPPQPITAPAANPSIAAAKAEEPQKLANVNSPRMKTPPVKKGFFRTISSGIGSVFSGLGTVVFLISRLIRKGLSALWHGILGK